MIYALLGLIVLVSLAIGLYCSMKNGELKAQVAALGEQIEDQEEGYAAELERVRAELAKLSKYAQIPDVLDRAKKTEEQIAAKLEKAEREASEVMREARHEAETIRDIATREAERQKAGVLGEIEEDQTRAREARRIAEWQANNIVDEARKQAKEIASQARKEAREKTQKVAEVLSLATAYATQIRSAAERRAEEIAGNAYRALERHDHYRAAVKAMENALSGYKDVYAVPGTHVLDELADEYAFHRAGESLKLARQRTRIMMENGLAASCNYPEGWKRDYAIEFVLGAFNGKVDALLARVRPAQHGKLAQEIKDAYAVVNHNGEVFRNTQINEEFLDSRLEELRWAVAVQRVKERQREEQRAIRERIREEEKARREYERAIKQAEKDEELINKALEKARSEFERASEQEKATYEAQLLELDAKLRELEEKNKRAISMAQQTKCGHVYVISNVGSFGESVYKIGLTRRLEPTDRVRELGDASVPFAFDIHAMIYSDDAPALETALHRRFVSMQVNKVNKRKEFFRLNLKDIRHAVDVMGLDTRWTMTAEATEYRETLALEQAMQSDAEFTRHWLEGQSAYVPSEDEDSDEEDMDQIDAEQVAQAED